MKKTNKVSRQSSSSFAKYFSLIEQRDTNLNGMIVVKRPNYVDFPFMKIRVKLCLPI